MNLEPDPAIVAEMKARGERPLELAHVTWGEDLKPLLEKHGLWRKSETPTSKRPPAADDIGSDRPRAPRNDIALGSASELCRFHTEADHPS